MGLCYEKNPRFSGGVYNSFVRRLTNLDDRLAGVKGPREDRRHALSSTSAVAEVGRTLKASFVVPTSRPSSWREQSAALHEKEPPELEDLLKTIRARSSASRRQDPPARHRRERRRADDDNSVLST